MAQKVQTWLIDDLDGSSPADETVTFAIDGKHYEIDLSSEHAQEFRALLELYRRKGRRAGTGNLRAKGMPPTNNRRTPFPYDDSAQVRDWIKQYNVPVPERGRVSKALRHVYTAFHKHDDREPLRTLLENLQLDPAAADTTGKTISTPAEPPKPAEDRDRTLAQQAGKRSRAQLTRLRKANASPTGTFQCTNKDGCATSCEALADRGLFTLIDGDHLYQITRAGRLWFDVHDVSPDL